MMRRALVCSFLALVWATPAFGQQISAPGGVGQNGAVTANDCVKWVAAGQIGDAGAACGSGSGGTPGGSNGQVQYNNAGAFGGFTLGGDCTLAQPTITCLKTNGVNFGAFATGTDAANLTGTVSVNRFNSGTGAGSSTFLRGDGTWATPAGSGTVTNVSAGPGLGTAAGTCNSGSITTTGTINTCQGVITKTANYTLVNGDGFKNFNFNNAAGGTFTIPQAGGAGFEAGIGFCFTSQAGAMTLSPTTSTLYGSGLSSAASVVIGAGSSGCVASDGTNYEFFGPPSGPATISGILTLQSGVVETVRTVTAAGAVTVTSADLHVCINKISGAATTVNLPASPTAGQRFSIDDCKGDAATNNITVTPAAGNIDGAGTFVINTNFGSWTGYYTGSIWKTVSSR